jgi:N-formylglutamate amidohydrolase
VLVMPAHYHRVRAGSPNSSVVLHVPHGSRHIPADVRAGLLLDDAALEAELDRMTDTGTGRIASHAADAAARRPWIFEHQVSRLVVDPERFPDEREEMSAVGMGAVYTRTAHGEPLRQEDARETQRLLDKYFHPYARAMAQLVDDRLAETGRVIILDVHSYPRQPLPYELHADGNRPDVCLGTDAFHTPQWLVGAARSAFADYGEVGMDTPFAGCYVPLRHHGAQPSVSALMIELRRDTYVGGETAGFRRPGRWRPREPLGAQEPSESVHSLGRPALALARLVDLCESSLSRSEHP